jgi:ATP-binding cassette subfamily F protein uup
VLEGKGAIGEYAGGYTDWLRQRKPATPVAAVTPPREKRAPEPARRPEKKRKLTFGETKELAGLPDVIEARERERDTLYASLSDGTFLRDGTAVVQARARLAEVEAEIERLIARWEDLETIAASG